MFWGRYQITNYAKQAVLPGGPVQAAARGLGTYPQEAGGSPGPKIGRTFGPCVGRGGKTTAV